MKNKNSKSSNIQKIPRKRVSEDADIPVGNDTFVKEKKVRLNKRNIFGLITAILLVGVILAFATMLFVRTNQITETDNPILKPFVAMSQRVFGKASSPAAIVNGEEITSQELESKYGRLPQDMRAMVTRDQFLDQLIDEKLLVQEARNRGYTASNEEIKEAIENLALQAGVDMAQLETILSEQNISIEELEEFFSREILITKVVNDQVINQVNVTQEDIEQFYAEREEDLIVPEAIRVSHILICHEDSMRCTSNTTREDALAQAEYVYGLINDTNFDEIAREFSEEPNAEISAGALQGQFLPGFVTRSDPFDETFLNASFDLDEGEVSEPVETVFGFHLIKVFEKKEEGPVPLDVVKDQINQTISNQKQKDRFNSMLLELKSKSLITKFNATG